jgi:hypothetical protein
MGNVVRKQFDDPNRAGLNEAVELIDGFPGPAQLPGRLSDHRLTGDQRGLKALHHLYTPRMPLVAGIDPADEGTGIH